MNKMTNVCICVLCGLPGAGKTTLTKLLHDKFDIIFVPICYDSLIPWIDFSDPDVLSTWKSYRNEVILLVKFLIDIIEKPSHDSFDIFMKNIHLINKEHSSYLHDLIKTLNCKDTCKVIFVIDDNMQYRRMRYEYFQIAKSCKLGFCTVMIDCPFHVCQERNQKRSLDEIVKLKSLRRINAQMEKPDVTKTVWEKFHCIINFEEYEIDSVLNKIYDVIQIALKNPILPSLEYDEELAEKTRIANRNNLCHQADLCLRKLIGTFMQQQDNPKQFSQTISYAKRYILHEITSGQIDERDYLTDSGTVDPDLLSFKLNKYLFSFLKVKS